MKTNNNISTSLDQSKKIASSNPQIEGLKFWTADIAAEYLSVSKPYLYGLVRQRLITFYRPVENGKIWFLEADISKWLLDSKSEAIKKSSWGEDEQREFIRARLG